MEFRIRLTARASMGVPLLLALALACAASVPAVAAAGTVTISGSTVAFSDPAGADNRVDVDAGRTVDCPDAAAWCVEIEDDLGAPAPGDGRCLSDGLFTTTCALDAKGAIDIDLGAGADLLASMTDAGDALTARGGPGNDTLYGRTGQETLDGGEGDDELYPDDNAYSPSVPTPGPDTVAGGPGTDRVWYLDHQSAVRLSLDGGANDGGAADVDNVQPDVEAIVGSNHSDVLVGSGAVNEIDGREGDDRIAGGAGGDKLYGNIGNDALDGGTGDDYLEGGSNDDTIVGGPGVDSFVGDGNSFSPLVGPIVGNDTINAADGNAEPVACGPGADTATVDASDQVASDEMNACETVRRASAAPQARFARLSAPALRGAVVRMRVTCRVSAAPGCRGRLTLRTAAKVRLGSRKRKLTLGRASFKLGPGKSRTVRIKLPRDARSLLRRTRRLRVTATAVSTRPKGLRSRRTFTLRRQ